MEEESDKVPLSPLMMLSLTDPELQLLGLSYLDTQICKSPTNLEYKHLQRLTVPASSTNASVFKATAKLMVKITSLSSKGQVQLPTAALGELLNILLCTSHNNLPALLYVCEAFTNHFLHNSSMSEDTEEYLTRFLETTIELVQNAKIDENDKQEEDKMLLELLQASTALILVDTQARRRPKSRRGPKAYFILISSYISSFRRYSLTQCVLCHYWLWAHIQYLPLVPFVLVNLSSKFSSMAVDILSSMVSAMQYESTQALLNLADFVPLLLNAVQTLQRNDADKCLNSILCLMNGTDYLQIWVKGGLIPVVIDYLRKNDSDMGTYCLWAIVAGGTDCVTACLEAGLEDVLRKLLTCGLSLVESAARNCAMHVLLECKTEDLVELASSPAFFIAASRVAPISPQLLRTWSRMLWLGTQLMRESGDVTNPFVPLMAEHCLPTVQGPDARNLPTSSLSLLREVGDQLRQAHGAV